MNASNRNLDGRPVIDISRREMLSRLGGGCGLVGLAAVLAHEWVAKSQTIVAAEAGPGYVKNVLDGL